MLQPIEAETMIVVRAEVMIIVTCTKITCQCGKAHTIRRGQKIVCDRCGCAYCFLIYL